MRTIKKIFDVINSKERIKLCLLSMAIFGGAIGDLACVSLIMPLASIAMDANGNNIYLFLIRKLVPNLNFSSCFGILCMLVALTFVLKDIYMLFLSKLEMKFVYQGQKNLAVRLVNNFFFAPYEFHLKYSPTTLQRKINDDVVLFYNAILSLMQIMSEILSCILLIGYLLYKEIAVTSMILLMIFVFSAFFLFYYRKRVLLYGEVHRSSDMTKNKILLETLSGIKEVKVFGKEAFFSSTHEEAYTVHANNLKKFQFANVVPKYSMEAIGVGSILFAISIRSFFGGEIVEIIPILSTFVVAAFRMMPAVNRILAGINTITFANDAIDDLADSLREHKQLEKSIQKTEQEKSDLEIDFQNRIDFSDVVFQYEGRDIPVLDHINLTIYKGESVAIIGQSGAGKTTLVDILLGLLPVSGGSVTVDGQDINSAMSSWHQKIGYIPQNIYLLDDTIRCNIAFGEPDIDETRLREAVASAQLNDVIAELPHGLDTVIGDRGIRLSGGQRQRIGIARALYRRPDILVLDEATSALDTETESAIMDEVYHLKGIKTLIIIAHRLSTISRCDRVYMIENGRVTEKRN